MSCKCGATVKAGECAVGITRFQLNEIRPYGAMRTRQAGEPAAEIVTGAFWRKTGQETLRPDSSGPRDDRGELERGHHRARRR
jgi:hypothetical protein